MSKYEWERGTITLPKKEWASFRTNALKFWNEKQEEILNEALRAFEACTGAGKGQRGKNRLIAQKEALHRFCGDRKNEWGYDWSSKFDRLETLLFKEGKLTKPKKSELKIVPTSKSAVLDLGFLDPETGADVSFNNETNSIYWEVEENNHAVEAANQNPFTRFLFRALSRVEWTRKTGGQIVGNDEYNRDSDYADGGGNYVTRSFGPLGKERSW